MMAGNAALLLHRLGIEREMFLRRTPRPQQPSPSKAFFLLRPTASAIPSSSYAPVPVTPDMILLGGVAYVILLLSLTMHEAAHAWAALRGGDPTAYQGGQVSLDPRPHIRREPLGMVFAPILFWVLGGWMIGWASTPFDPRWAFAHPRRAAAMAAAGPLANLFLLLLAALGLRLGVATEVFLPVPTGFFELALAPEGGVASALVVVLSFTFSLNLLLFVFNLIPVPPLDGSSAIGLLLSDEAGRRLQQFMAQPMLAWGGILVAWFLMGRIFSPTLAFAVDLLYLGVD
jgi:Zn-dependent protease